MPRVSAPVPSPRRWWAGPLDVEQLAWGAVEDARDAVQALVDARGQGWRVGTSPELVAASFAAIEHLRVVGEPVASWAPMSGFVRAVDGWVRTHANYPHHAAALGRALGATDRASLERAVAGRTALDVEEAVHDAGGIAVAVRRATQWAAHPQGVATSGEPWVSVDAGRERAPLSGGALPLDGVRVLDLTRVIAGPAGSQLMACLGADVLRIDPPARPEIDAQFLSNGMGKRSATADLAEHRTELEALLAGADVVLLGYRPGSLDRFGLGPDALAQRHPHLVVGSLSAWGERGPWARRAGFDSIVQAASGVALACSPDDGATPGALPVQALDHATGYALAAGVVRLLVEGRAGVVWASLLGAARTLLGFAAPPEERVAELGVPHVTVRSAAGTLNTVPPPLTLDGASVERDVAGYGAASLRWA
ncbi:CoA transferase [Micrococcus porci]|uniref:CoA transferase n=1 Tax=Micrococcus porci TaxID=2856555 RepID=UPI001CCDE91A|nr:CoA transferase [Micrococcus porci]UBH25004.1 CoA transferase [Micrococcus porci]